MIITSTLANWPPATCYKYYKTRTTAWGDAKFFTFISLTPGGVLYKSLHTKIAQGFFALRFTAKIAASFLINFINRNLKISSITITITIIK